MAAIDLPFYIMVASERCDPLIDAFGMALILGIWSIFVLAMIWLVLECRDSA